VTDKFRECSFLVVKSFQKEICNEKENDNLKLTLRGFGYLRSIAGPESGQWKNCYTIQHLEWFWTRVGC
jgi:hypothetical protein